MSYCAALGVRAWRISKLFFCVGGDGTHESALARSVRSEEAEHVISDREGEILQSLNAVWVGLREISAGKSQGGILLAVQPVCF